MAVILFSSFIALDSTLNCKREWLVRPEVYEHLVKLDASRLSFDIAVGQYMYADLFTTVVAEPSRLRTRIEVVHSQLVGVLAADWTVDVGERFGVRCLYHIFN